MSQRRWNLCLLGAFLLTVVAFLIGLVIVPALLDRPGIAPGPLAICGVWFLALIVYAVLESRRP